MHIPELCHIEAKSRSNSSRDRSIFRNENVIIAINRKQVENKLFTKNIRENVS